MTRRLLFLFTLFLTFGLAACTEPAPPSTNALDDAYRSLTLDDPYTGGTLPASIDNVTITWSANPAALLDGYALRPALVDTSVTLTALLSHEGDTLLKTFTVTIPGDDTAVQARLDNAEDQLILADPLTDLSLPDVVGEVSISWSADPASMLVGTTVLPQVTDASVTLIATLEDSGITRTKTFTVTVPGDDSAVRQQLNEAATTLEDLLEMTSPITTDLDLPTSYEGIAITYLSDTPGVLADDGTVTRPDAETGDVTVELTVELEKDGVTTAFTLTYTVAADVETIVYTGYYEGATGLSGDLLRVFLHNLIDDHTVLSYSDLWTALAYTDQDPNNPNNVILLYSQVSMSASNTGGDIDEWNREHVWPRSHGDLDENGHPGNTDLHHIRPTKVPVNSSRGNLDFDEGGSLVSGTTDAYKDADSFEPPDVVKGDIARMLFYMAIRYEGDLSNENDLELNNLVNNSGPYVGVLDILLQWHEEDPVDAFEMTRNDRIFELQGNRNPFIDHPEFAYLIFVLNQQG
jgi:endonuclease I